MQKNPTREELLDLITDTVTDAAFRRATFAGATRGAATEWVRVVIRPVDLRGETHFQFAYQGAKKAVTKNFLADELEAPLDELIGHGYAGIHITTNAEEIDIRTSRKGRVHVGRHRLAQPVPAAAPEPHNRTKDVPLPEGKPDRLLEVMGVATPDGRIRPTMRAKFTQINEFLKQFRHALDETDLARLGREVTILDCGCGSSYLTLAAHHYLKVLGIPARVLGVDVNEDVIRKSVDRAEELGAAGLLFECTKIGTVDVAADVVFALHACDTATDDAIAQAVRSEARLLLSVPCCHHDLNRVIRAEGPSEVLLPVLRHGIMLQRAADLVTDAFRALALRIMGYRTDVVEFVATEHTPRNLMIRAVRVGNAASAAADAAHVAEYQEMKRFWRVTPYIEKVLGEEFQQRVKA